MDLIPVTGVCDPRLLCGVSWKLPGIVKDKGGLLCLVGVLAILILGAARPLPGVGNLNGLESAWNLKARPGGGGEICGPEDELEGHPGADGGRVP